MAHGIIWWMVVGLIAGWAAGRIMKGGGYGVIRCGSALGTPVGRTMPSESIRSYFSGARINPSAWEGIWERNFRRTHPLGTFHSSRSSNYTSERLAHFCFRCVHRGLR